MTDSPAAAGTTRLTVAVTGASGFVGSALVAHLAADPRFDVRGCYRRLPDHPARGSKVAVTGDLVDGAGWAEALAGADAVVHAAARAHVLNETASNALAAFRQVNVEGTVAVARAAVAAGVRRFVLLSTIKVNGERTAPGRTYRETDPPAPEDAYGRSKLEAEVALRALGAETGLEVVVLRPPLVLGPGAKGNLARLSRWISQGIPLPFGAVDNCRSLIHIDSLCTAIEAALTVPQAAGRTYLVADRDWSMPQLVRALADAVGREARLIPVPVPVLRMAGRLAGRGAEIDRLTGSLLVDAGPARADLGLVRID